MYSQTPVAYSIRIWRRLLQWFGGLGIIFLLLVILPSSVSLKRLYFAEGKTEQMTPNIKHTSKIFIKIYSILTIIAVSLYLLVGLDIFNAICYSFSGLGTGGFSADPNNLNNFRNPLIQIVTMLVMIMGGTNFVMHYHIMKGRWKNMFKDIEVKYMFIFIILATIIIAFNLLQHNVYNHDILVTFRHALFQVISILTSTGFQTTDINVWPALSFHILIILMFIGGSVCSTASGIKIYNVVIILKSVWWEIQSIYLPKNIVIKRKVFHDNKDIDISFMFVRSILMFFITYLLLFVISTIILLIFCNDFQIAYSIVAGSIGNTGLGPSYINTSIPDIVKIVLIFDFLAGRIGLWPALLPLVYINNSIQNGYNKNFK
jgi:trk system potassium uptake protein TrkH